MSMNPFPVADLPPEVESMHCNVWNRRHWTDSEFAWTLSCFHL